MWFNSHKETEHIEQLIINEAVSSESDEFSTTYTFTDGSTLSIKQQKMKNGTVNKVLCPYSDARYGDQLWLPDSSISTFN